MTSALLMDEPYELLAELEARDCRRAQLIDWNFPKQAEFVLDTSPRSSALCTRRAGKSRGAGAKFFVDSIDHPGANYLYLGLTRKSAKGVMWEPIIKKINTQFGFGGEPNEADLTLTLKGGGMIYLAGADATTQQMERYLGYAYRGVIIDEAGSFKQNVQKLVEENLEPALADWGGWINLIGTPTSLTGSYFHKVTTGQFRSWNVHSWSTFENPYMASQWEKIVRQRKMDYGEEVEKLPWYRRMYLGQWVIDDDSLVYKYDARRNTASALPPGRYVYVLGIDLGYNDATAFVLLAYNGHQKNIYVVEAFKKSGMDITDVVNQIEHYRARFEIHDIVIDNASKQAVEEIKNRHNVPLEAAEKRGKADVIEVQNSDLVTGRVKLLPEAEAALGTEMENLIWDESKKPKKEEHPSCENHACDAYLYAWRKCKAYLSDAGTGAPKTEEEELDEWERQEAQRLELVRSMNIFDY